MQATCPWSIGESLQVDSLLSARNDSEHESSRRIKTEFLTGLDGVQTTDNERLLILGATNRCVDCVAE